MAERFGAQEHPSGGLRFGSQEYAPLNDTAAGVLHAVEVGVDVFAADSYPRIHGELAATESGEDVASIAGSSSRVLLVDLVESATPDAFIASGLITGSGSDPSLRFGSQDHPSGGLRFGSQSWGALGPSGPLEATESGSDAIAASGFVVPGSYTLEMFDVIASFINYTSESLGAAISGTLENGYKVMLPVSGPGGITFTWETNALGAPSLRLSHYNGPNTLSDIPWYVWDGTTWTAAKFNLSDSLQGAVFLVETGNDTAIFSGGQARIGSLAAVEIFGEDFVNVQGGVRIAGAMAATELDVDTFEATGEPRYIGDAPLLEASDPDTFEAQGEIEVSGDLVLAELASDTFSAVGGLSASGDLDATESGADSLSAVGRVRITASLGATESDTPDTLEGAGTVRVSGSIAPRESGDDVFEAEGQLDRSGSISLREVGADVVEISGAVLVAGDLAATDQLDKFTCFGVRESTGDVIAAELNATEGGADRFVSRGRIGTLVEIPTFDGPVETVSTTRVVSVLSRRTAEAA